MSASPSTDRFPSAEPAAKRQRRETTPPLLRTVLGDAFEILFLRRQIHQDLPQDLQEIMLEYLAPGALQKLVATPDAVLVHNDQLTQPLKDALQEVFNFYATDRDEFSIHNRVMSMEDMMRWASDVSRGCGISLNDAQNHGHMQTNGLPRPGDRKQLGLGGFLQLYWKICKDHSKHIAMRSELNILAKALYP